VTFMSGMSLRIVSVSPETVNIYQGHALPQRFLVTYEIDGADKDTKAEISVRSDGVGELQRFEVAVEPHAQVDFLLNASSFDLGPTVRFRVRCPAGDTDWQAMGTEGTPISSQISTPQIGNVHPQYIATPGSRLRPAGVGLPVNIVGAHFTQECKPEAMVDDTPVELQTLLILDSEIRTFFLYRHLQGRPVSRHYLLVNLIVSSTKERGAYGDTFYLNFKD